MKSPWSAMMLAALVCGVAAFAAGAPEEEMEFQGAPLFHIAAGPAEGLPVLLLHGGAFDSSTWQRLETIQVLADAGYRVFAVDLPGHGKSPAQRVDPGAFGVALLDHLELERAVVVSPSMSGRVSFPLVLEHPERVAGFVPIAPVESLAYAKRLRDSAVPALIIWGEEDQLFPASQAEVLAKSFAAAEVVILPDARHPAYLDQPERFHAAVLTFLAGIAAAPE